jgi:hypothetical protein
MLHNCAFITLLLGEHYGKRSTVEALPRQPADETQKKSAAGRTAPESLFRYHRPQPVLQRDGW